MIATLVLLGCSDDGGGGGAASSTTAAPGAEGSSTTSAAGSTTLRVGGVPFMFDVPSDFIPVPTEALPAGFKAIFGLDQLNFVDIRLTAEEELSDEQLASDLRPAIEASSTRIVEEGIVRRGELTLTRYVVEASSDGTPTLSHLHFFRAGGMTWEIACQSDEAGRDRIDDACDLMLDTLTLTE